MPNGLVVAGYVRPRIYSLIVPYGALDDTTIDYGGRSRAIAWLALQTYDDDTTEDWFVFFLHNATAFLPRGSVLNVGGTRYTLDADSEYESAGEYRWDAPNAPRRRPGQKVTVSLVLGNFPAEGRPTIAGTAERFTGTPEIGLGLSEAGRDYSLGWRLVRAGDDTNPEHVAGFKLTVRF